MKKKYIQPQIKARAVKANTILAGSMEVYSSGSTGEQNAKPAIDFEDNILDIGLENDILKDNY